MTLPKLTQQRIVNLDNSVYEIGDLPLDYRRVFVASIIQRDFAKARAATLEGTLTPRIVYVIEEANTIFNSYSFRKNDEYSTVLSDFVSVGRNIGGGMSAFLVSTAASGEIAPSLRRRARMIYGRIQSAGDLQEARRRDKALAAQIKNQPRFTFSYAGQRIHTARIPDTVTNVPEDYKPDSKHIHTTTQPSQFTDKWWLTFGSTLGIFLLFWTWLMAL